MRAKTELTVVDHGDGISIHSESTP
jgi:hypothetical protein